MSQRNQIFISYADPDRVWVDRLRSQLSAVSDRLWDRSQIRAGVVRQEAINQALAQARVAVVLLSADYMVYMQNVELDALLQLAANRQTEIVTVLVRPCLYQSSALAQFGMFEAEPGKVIALSSLRSADAEAALVRLAADLLARIPKDNQPAAAWSAPAASAPPASSAPAGSREPTPASLRRLLNAVIPVISDLDAFVLDNFRDVYLLYQPMMDRTAKVNLLLHKGDRARILAHLRAEFPDGVEKFKGLISYEG